MLSLETSRGTRGPHEISLDFLIMVSLTPLILSKLTSDSMCINIVAVNEKLIMMFFWLEGKHTYQLALVHITYTHIHLHALHRYCIYIIVQRHAYTEHIPSVLLLCADSVHQTTRSLFNLLPGKLLMVPSART